MTCQRSFPPFNSSRVRNVQPGRTGTEGRSVSHTQRWTHSIALKPPPHLSMLIPGSFCNDPNLSLFCLPFSLLTRFPLCIDGASSSPAQSFHLPLSAPPFFTYTLLDLASLFRLCLSNLTCSPLQLGPYWPDLFPFSHDLLMLIITYMTCSHMQCISSQPLSNLSIIYQI